MKTIRRYRTFFRDQDAPKALLYYLLLIALFYGPVIFLGKTLLPGNYYPHGVMDSWPYGYTGTIANHTLSIDLATPAYYEFPMNKLIGEQYKHFTAPLWNPYQGAGTPLAAQYSSKAFFPYQILEDIAPVSTWDFFLLGRLVIAGIFTFLFLRSISLTFSSAFLGGVFYMFSGTFVWFINLEQMVNVAMVAPYLLLCMEALARRGRMRDVASSSLAFGLVLLAGQPETAMYVLFFGVLYFFLRLFTAPAQGPGGRLYEERTSPWRPFRSTGKIIIAFAIGFCLSAPVVVPFVELWGTAQHIHPAGGDMGVRDPNPVHRAVNIITPTFYERPLDPSYSRHPLGEVKDSFGKPLYSKFFPNNGEWDYLGGYSGVMILFLSLAGALTAIFKGRHRLKLLSIFFFGFGLSVLLKNFGVVPFLWLGKLPLFDQVWSQRWAGPVWTLAFAISGAIGFEIIKGLRFDYAHDIVEESRIRSIVDTLSKNSGFFWGLVLHSLLCWVSLLGSLYIFNLFTKLLTGEALTTLRSFAVHAFFLPVIIIFTIAYIFGSKREDRHGPIEETDTSSERASSPLLSFRSYKYILIYSYLAVNLLVIILAASGLIETDESVYIGGFEVFAVFFLAFLLLCTLLVVSWGVTIFNRRYDSSNYMPVSFAIASILIFYFYALAFVPDAMLAQMSIFKGDIVGPYYFASIFMGKVVAVGALVIAGLLCVLFLRTSKGVYALIGLSILELWFVIPRCYGPQWLNYKLVPLSLGLMAVLFIVFRWWRLLGVSALVMLATFLWIDYSSPYGFPERYDPFTPAPYVKFLKSRSGYYRSMGSYGVLFPNYASSVGLHDVRFINSMAVGAFQDYRLANLHTVEVSRETSSALWFTGRPELHVLDKGWIDVKELGAEDEFKDKLRYYSMLSVRYFLSPADREIDMKGFRLIYDKEIKIYENKKALPRVYMATNIKKVDSREAALIEITKRSFNPLKDVALEGDVPDFLSGGIKGANHSRASITHYDYDRVVVAVQTKKNAMLVLTDVWYDGWKAYVDGAETPIYRVNSLIRGVALKGGKHTVVFQYAPRSFRFAMYVFVLASLSLLSMVIVDNNKKAAYGNL